MSHRSEALLNELLASRLPETTAQWLDEACQKAAAAGPGPGLFMAFGLVPRRVGRAGVQPTAAEVGRAADIAPGLGLQRFSLDQLARLRLVLAAASAPGVRPAELLEHLAADGDVGELTALYQGLPLMPEPETLVEFVREGLRTNMTEVFSAIALDNPHPAAHLPEPAWNQLVLKTVFLGLPLSRVVGLSRRHNAALARALADHAAERQAAGRALHPEAGPYLKYPADDDPGAA